MLVIEYTHYGDGEIQTLAAEQDSEDKVRWSFNDGEEHGGDIDTFLSVMRNIKNNATILDIHGSIDAYYNITQGLKYEEKLSEEINNLGVK